MRRDKVRIEGSENLTRYRTSASFEYRFCRSCGCMLFAYEDSEPDMFYVNLPTLDGGVNPGHPKDMESHIYMRSKSEWEEVSDAIPQFDRDGPGEVITAIQKTDD